MAKVNVYMQILLGLMLFNTVLMAPSIDEAVNDGPEDVDKRSTLINLPPNCDLRRMMRDLHKKTFIICKKLEVMQEQLNRFKGLEVGHLQQDVQRCEGGMASVYQECLTLYGKLESNLLLCRQMDPQNLVKVFSCLNVYRTMLEHLSSLVSFIALEYNVLICEMRPEVIVIRKQYLALKELWDQEALFLSSYTNSCSGFNLEMAGVLDCYSREYQHLFVNPLDEINALYADWICFDKGQEYRKVGQELQYKIRVMEDRMPRLVKLRQRFLAAITIIQANDSNAVELLMD